jgi:hypothetical protein
MSMKLPALSIRQPWAWLILTSGKDIENRSWGSALRGTFLIHAAKGMTRTEYESAEEFADPVCWLPPFESLDRGGICGAARITDCRPNRADERKSHWEIPGAIGFVLESPALLPFRQYKGALGFFQVEITADEERLLREAGLVS